MDNDNLVRMVNRIGDFFSAMPDRDEALNDIALHLRRFWEPRMRAQLLEHLEKRDGAGVAPIVSEALTRHRSMFV